MSDKLKSFLIRFRSSIVLMAFLVFFIWMGGYYMFAGVFAITIIGVFEYMRMLKLHKSILMIYSLSAVVVYYIFIFFKLNDYFFEYLVGAMLVLMAIYVFTFPRYNQIQISQTFLVLGYVVAAFSYMYLTRILPAGTSLVIMIFIGSWGSDVTAYCVGILIGKHHPFKALSPKKSAEGCIGGIVGAGLIGFIFGFCMYKFGDTSNLDFKLPVQYAFALMGMGGSFISQIGDLAASAMKRNNNIKDYGRLIPGHGGILDRFDSVIFTAPVVYFLAHFL